MEETSKAYGFSRAKGYNLVRKREFPCHVTHIGRRTRVVTTSVLRSPQRLQPTLLPSHTNTPRRSDPRGLFLP